MVFPPCSDKVPYKGNLGKMNLSIQSITSGKAWQEECEVAVFLVSTVRKQRKGGGGGEERGRGKGRKRDMKAGA